MMLYSAPEWLRATFVVGGFVFSFLGGVMIMLGASRP